MPTKEDILHVARSARLNLTGAELEKLTEDANEILSAFEKIKDADTMDIEPSFQPIGTSNVLRDDVVTEPLKQDDALRNTEHRKDGYFKGPRIL